MRKILFFLFGILLFFVPLVMFPWNSEIFEFNKMVLVYALTALIIAAWIVESIIAKKFIFRRTILDIPLLLFLGSQIISTLLSIDPRTSFLGYYSRFNGGLLSTISYSLLYWAFVSNFDLLKIKKFILIILASGVLVSSIGVFEHFGIFPTCVSINNYQIEHNPKVVTGNKLSFLFSKCWEQDAQSRVFSTFGQPNWLAAWLVAIIPITWALILESKFKDKKFFLYFSVSILLFITLLFTKSRSGLLGFVVADVIYWALTLFKNWKEHLKPFVVCHLSFAFLALVIGTQFTPSLVQFLDKRPTTNDQQQALGPALEVGGTESGTIRKIVWKGAIEVWKHYPIFGTGVETFAFSYPLYAPVEHNLVSEWDFIYNKAHNEYLNFAANTGTFGIVTYLVFVGFSVYILFKLESYALLAGFVSLLVTNFFGFSVVPTQILLFLFPAFALAGNSTEYRVLSTKLGTTQKVTIFFVLCTMLYVLFAVGKYWYADYIFQKGVFNENTNLALNYYTNAIALAPNEAKYHNNLAGYYTNQALAAYQQKDAQKTSEFIDSALTESQKSIDLSPNNIGYKKTRFGIFIKFSTINSSYFKNAQDLLVEMIKETPTDAKLYYSLGTIYARTGQIDKSLETLKKTIELKANYREARLAYALILISQKRNMEAKVQLEYILKYLDPNDSLTKQTLESIK